MKLSYVSVVLVALCCVALLVSELELEQGPERVIDLYRDRLCHTYRTQLSVTLLDRGNANTGCCGPEGSISARAR